MLVACEEPRPAAPPTVTASTTYLPARGAHGAWRVTRYESLNLPLHHEVGMMAMWSVAIMRFEVMGDGVRIDLGGAEFVEGRLMREGTGLHVRVDAKGVDWLSGALERKADGRLLLTTDHARLSLSPDGAGLGEKFCVDDAVMSLTRRDRCEPREVEQALPVQGSP